MSTLRTARGDLHALVDPPASLISDLSDHGEPGGYVDRLRDEVHAREIADAEERWPTARRDVVVLGDDELADDVATALRELSVRVERGTEVSHIPPGASLVISVAATRQERACWAELDRLPERGVGWIRAYREDAVWFVDPVAFTPEDPTAHHVLRRRIAAAPDPIRAEAYARTDVPTPAPAIRVGRALTTARVLTVSLAWAQRSPDLELFSVTLWKFVSCTGRVSEHPILGYPEPAEGVTTVPRE
ncbi:MULTISPECIES: hypothetical protein [Gordonia]|uniref:hypothetical protein n=1 Tax=Gordonia TaxID=2053 RepID=UPI0030192B77